MKTTTHEHYIVLESLTESIEAMSRIVELAKSKGFYDANIAASAFKFVEAGLKLSQCPPEPMVGQLTDEQVQTAKAFVNDCTELFGLDTATHHKQQKLYR